MAGKTKGKIQDEALQEEAQRLMAEALGTGIMTLKSGTKMALDSKSMLALVEWIASRAPVKPKIVKGIEDLPIQETSES
jgi:hypothetical protein